MHVSEMPIKAEVYDEDSKDAITTYRLKVHIEALGMWLNGVKVVVFHEGTGECKVYKPSYWNPRKKKFDSDIDFDNAYALWNLIADSSVEAVEKSQNIILKRVQEE